MTKKEVKLASAVVKDLDPAEPRRLAASLIAVCASSALETHEAWREASRYLNTNALKEHDKLTLKAAA